mgnify:CR=1 FL=1
MRITPRKYNNKWVCLFYDDNGKAIRQISSGWMMSDVITILGSLDIVLGEIDR